MDFIGAIAIILGLLGAAWGLVLLFINAFRKPENKTKNGRKVFLTSIATVIIGGFLLKTFQPNSNKDNSFKELRNDLNSYSVENDTLKMKLGFLSYGTEGTDFIKIGDDLLKIGKAIKKGAPEIQNARFVEVSYSLTLDCSQCLAFRENYLVLKFDRSLLEGLNYEFVENYDMLENAKVVKYDDMAFITAQSFCTRTDVDVAHFCRQINDMAGMNLNTRQ